MPAIVERLPDEPIILITIEGQHNIENARSIWSQTTELIKDIEGMIYRIVDVRNMEISFSDMMALTTETLKGQAGAAIDPRIKTVYVGNNPMNRIIRDKVYHETKTEIQIPTFWSLEEAHEYIRRQREQEDIA